MRNFTYQAGSWTKPRRVVAKVEWHPGELYQRVDQLRALTNQEIAGPKQHGAGLLFLRLDRNETHGRSDSCLRNRLRVGGVIFLAFNERLDIDRRDQASLMSQIADYTSPMMRAPARFHSDDATWLFLRRKARKSLT